MDRATSEFVAMTTVMVLTPGPGMAYLTNVVLSSGRGAGYRGVLGLMLGTSVWAALALLGFSVLLTRWPTALRVTTACGGAYLIWIAVRPLVRKWRVPPRVDRHEAPSSRVHSLRDALLTNLLNPTLGLYYLIVIPRFVPAGAATQPYVLRLAIIHICLSASWLLCFVAGLHAILKDVSYRWAWKALTVGSAVLLALFGFKALLAASR